MINKSIPIHLFFLVLLVLLECAGVGYLGIWREGFWQAVEQKQATVFIYKLAEFTGIALMLCIISGYSTYLINKTSMLMRTQLTIKSLSCDYQTIEGGTQRVQEDCFNYPWYGLTLLVGLLRSCLNLGIFAVIIVIQLNVIYLVIPVIYTLIGTGIAYVLAKPLIKLNYLHQCVEAKFRQILYAIKPITHYPPMSHKRIKGGYGECYTNYMKLAVTTKKLQYFQSFYNQITVVVPYIIIAPLYFSSQILFGTFMQIASAVSHMIDSMSYIINSYDIMNNWLSCRRRLQELGVLHVKNK